MTKSPPIGWPSLPHFVVGSGVSICVWKYCVHLNNEGKIESNPIS